jgi:serine O-acetyltransferase
MLISQKQVIAADTKAWAVNLKIESGSLVSNILRLFGIKEFRNLYYFRLMKGGPIIKALLCILKIIYPGRQDLLIDPSCRIGAGLFIQHGYSTIIMGDMGKNCWVNQQVTIGYKDAESDRPRLGDEVKVFAGAKIIGEVVVGNNAKIGANAVVVKDVPDNCTVAGVPARVVRLNGKRTNEH